LTSPSPSSMSIVSTSELIMVVSANIADLFHFLFLFFASAASVAPWEAGIFPMPRTPWRDDLGWRPTRHGTGLVVAPHRRVRDVLVDGRRRHRLHVRCVADLVTALVLVQWCRAPVDALAVLQNKTQKFN
jgi:hypothetical protein